MRGIWLAVAVSALFEPESYLRGVKALDQISHFDAVAEEGDGLEVPGGAEALQALKGIPTLQDSPFVLAPPVVPLPVAATPPAPPATLAAPAPAVVHESAILGRLAAAEEQGKAATEQLDAAHAQAQSFDAELHDAKTLADSRKAQLDVTKDQVASLETKLRKVGSYVDKLKSADEEKLRRTQAIARSEAHKVKALQSQLDSDTAVIRDSQGKGNGMMAEVAEMRRERDAATAELKQYTDEHAAEANAFKAQAQALVSEKANAQQLRDNLQEGALETASLKSQLQSAQATAAGARREDAERTASMKVKWLNFTSSVQGVLRKEDEELASAKALAASSTAALASERKEKALLSQRLQDVSTEAQRMGESLKGKADLHDTDAKAVAEAQSKERVAEAATEHQAARAEALEHSLAQAKAESGDLKSKAAAAEEAKAQLTQAARDAADVAARDETDALREKEHAAEQRADLADARVRSLQNVTAEDARLLRAAALRLRTPMPESKKAVPDKELLGQLSQVSKRLRQAIAGWKRSKAEVHALRLAAQRDSTEMSQFRTTIAQQRQELRDNGGG